VKPRCFITRVNCGLMQGRRWREPRDYHSTRRNSAERFITRVNYGLMQGNARRFVKELERELERKGILVRREPVPVSLPVLTTG